MALVLETGAGVIGANSYVDSAGATATAYFAEHLHAATWASATAPQKQAAVIQATRMIDAAFDWLGTRKTTTQGLDWPRDGVLLDGVSQDGLVPLLLIQATLEQALALLSGDRTGASASGTGAVTSIGLGNDAVELQFAENATLAARDLGFLTDWVAQLLAPLGTRQDQRTGAGMVKVYRA